MLVRGEPAVSMAIGTSNMFSPLSLSFLALFVTLQHLPRWPGYHHPPDTLAHGRFLDYHGL